MNTQHKKYGLLQVFGLLFVGMSLLAASFAVDEHCHDCDHASAATECACACQMVQAPLAPVIESDVCHASSNFVHYANDETPPNFMLVTDIFRPPVV
jgi:hypothetical protein